MWVATRRILSYFEDIAKAPLRAETERPTPRFFHLELIRPKDIFEIACTYIGRIMPKLYRFPIGNLKPVRNSSSARLGPLPT